MKLVILQPAVWGAGIHLRIPPLDLAGPATLACALAVGLLAFLAYRYVGLRGLRLRWVRRRVELLPPAADRFEIAMRVLAAMTAAEGTVGTFWTMRIPSALRHLARVYRAAPRLPRWDSAAALHAAHPAMAVALAVNVSLIACALLLWRLKKNGLAVLCWILGVEVALFALGSGVPATGRLAALFGDFELARTGFLPQMSDWYPAAAVALVVIAYRGLQHRIPKEQKPAGARARAVARAKATFEILAATSFLAGAGGISVTPLAVFNLRSLAAPPAASHVPFAGWPTGGLWIGYASAAAALVFCSALIVCAFLLWRLRRAGLAVLGWTLAAEVALLMGGFALPPGGVAGPGGGSAAPQLLSLHDAVFLGSLGLSQQVLTAFPLVAAILIFLAYRYIGPAAKGGATLLSPPQA